jgi:hypothetical protein
VKLDVAGALGDLLQRLAQSRIELDDVHPLHPRRQLGGQRPLTAADLEHDVGGIGIGLAHDRREQVRVR